MKGNSNQRSLSSSELFAVIREREHPMPFHKPALLESDRGMKRVRRPLGFWPNRNLKAIPWRVAHVPLHELLLVRVSLLSNYISAAARSTQRRNRHKVVGFGNIGALWNT
jgi:hypothetical protein